MIIKVRKLYSGAIVPTYANVGDAGADLYSAEYFTLYPGDWKLVKTGIALEIPLGYVGLVNPRSGMAAKFGITVLNAPGTVDSGYRGEVLVNLINLGREVFKVGRGDRIAQILFQPCPQASLVLADELSLTVRGEGGHGSTGGFNG